MSGNIMSEMTQATTMRVAATEPSESCPGCTDIRDKSFPFEGKGEWFDVGTEMIRFQWDGTRHIDTEGCGNTDEIHFCPVCGVPLGEFHKVTA